MRRDMMKREMMGLIVTLIILAGTATVFGQTNLTVARHPDNTIWKMTCDGTSNCSSWTQVGGGFSVQPTLTWDPSIQKYICVGIGNNGSNIWRTTFEADGTWNNDWVLLGTGATGSPSPVGVVGGGFSTPNPQWSQILPASTRFVLVMGGGAVLDKETGLVWERSPSAVTFDWSNAHIHCNALTVGNRKGWRLPTLQELASLVDPSVLAPGPGIPVGHPFSNVHSSSYWSATTSADLTAGAWDVYFGGSSNGGDPDPRVSKTSLNFVWCVRGGQGVDPQ